MGHLIHTSTNPAGFVHLREMNFDCPGCGKHYDENFYFKELQVSDGLIYKKCPHCHEVIGITVGLKGEIKAWLKKPEDENALV